MVSSSDASLADIIIFCGSGSGGNNGDGGGGYLSKVRGVCVVLCGCVERVKKSQWPGRFFVSAPAKIT